MKKLKISLKLILVITIISLSAKLWIKYNASFRLDKIQPKEFFQNTFKTKSYDSNLDDILNQEYRFLSKGRQSFVFVSSDDKYIIKFFRFHRYSEPFWTKCFNIFHFLKFCIKKNLAEKNDLYFKTMNSYKLAFEKLKSETATIYVHLNPTQNLNNKFIIYDKFKKRHFIDLNNLGFIIQKKAEPFNESLLKIKNDKNALENLITSFFDNLDSIYSKNIINKDRHLMQNLAVIDNKVIEIDIGSFHKKKEFNKNNLKKEIKNYTLYLKKWLEKNISDSAHIVDDKIQKLIDNK